ncbi:glycoside hydrolase family 73 protein [Lacticaseibacillus saniviri]|uniref:glycoside hydrolase family 73 protein n=1 Tax=Lacticaseibacillus saniviri TaxID=931533 RepID=UPI0006D285A1|nr:glycoside hydrolase family 73 protein [Lacticaseibacillus saniviri]
MAKRRRRLPLSMWLILILLIAGGGIVLSQFRNQQEQAQLAEKNSAEIAASKNAFIRDHAVYAKRLQQAYGVLPSITLAQAILESNWGNSGLAKNYHNLFGVKGTDPSNTKLLTTQEYVNGEWQTVKARFRVYSDDSASMKDHVLLFVNGTDWNPQQYAAVLAAKDYREAAVALQTSGYATDPDYPSKLISLVKEYDLDQYD